MKLKLESNKKIIFVHKNHSVGMSLVETMVGIILFFLVFGAVFKAFAPTATASHNLLRGVTIATNACNWYLNELEQKIHSEGAISSYELGENNVTSVFLKEDFSDIAMLRSLKATSKITIDNNLYTAKIIFRWGNHENDTKRSHSFELSRLIVQPDL